MELTTPPSAAALATPLAPAGTPDGETLEPIPEQGRARRIAAWTLAAGFGGFLLWAALAPLDEGVAAPGAVAIDTKRKPVQHLTGGIVKEVLVREGQQVR